MAEESSITELDFVHLAILKDAAEIANRQVATEMVVPQQRQYRAGERFNAAAREKRTGFISGEVYRPDALRSQKGGLCLSIDPVLVSSLEPDQVAHLREIGIKAIRSSLIKNRHEFVGIILGEARRGVSYFDRYLSPGQQTRLF